MQDVLDKALLSGYRCLYRCSIIYRACSGAEMSVNQMGIKKSLLRSHVISSTTKNIRLREMAQSAMAQNLSRYSRLSQICIKELLIVGTLQLLSAISETESLSHTYSRPLFVVQHPQE